MFGSIVRITIGVAIGVLAMYMLITIMDAGRRALEIQEAVTQRVIDGP